jgi:hypothetical protein
MALYSTCEDLKQAIREETERTNNGKFEAALPRIIAAAEQRMFYGAGKPLESPAIRVRSMEETGTLSLVSGSAALPAGYLSTLHLFYDGAPDTNPVYEAPHTFFQNRLDLTSGSPTRYTIRGSTLYVSPLITGSLTFHYYKRPDALEDGTDSNDVLTDYPMVYFYAAVTEAFAYLRNPGEMQKNFGAYLSLAGGLAKTERDSKRSSSPLAMRPGGP